MFTTKFRIRPVGSKNWVESELVGTAEEVKADLEAVSGVKFEVERIEVGESLPEPSATALILRAKEILENFDPT